MIAEDLPLLFSVIVVFWVKINQSLILFGDVQHVRVAPDFFVDAFSKYYVTRCVW